MDKSMIHIGILGMHWGKRKGTSATSTGSDDHKTTSGLKSRGSKHLTNEELKKAISRIELEKRYKELTGEGRPSFGKQLVMNVLSGAGQQVATEYTAKYLKQGVESLLKARGLG